MSAVSSGLTFDWKRAGLALLLIEAVLLGLYFGTVEKMVGIWWRSETFNHAFLVPPISCWLIWEKRHTLAYEVPRPSIGLLVPFAIAAFVWLLGELAAVNAATQFALVAMIVLAVPIIIGVPAARQIAFPLAFLFFAVPFGEFVMPTLMDWTAKFTVAGLRATGIPVYQEGLHFVIPSGRWSVVEACSGVRYLIASIVVGTLYAYLNYRSLKRRLVFVGFSIIVPLVANWVRAYMIVMIGHLSGNQLAVGIDHLIYGWVFFGVVIMIMFAIGMRWREPDAETMPALGATVGKDGIIDRSRLVSAMVLVLAFAMAPRGFLASLEYRTDRSPAALEIGRLAVADWQLVEEPLSDWRPAFQNPSATLNVRLEKSGRSVGIFIAYYRQQGFERKLISSDNVVVRSDDKDWALVDRTIRPVHLGRDGITLRETVLRNQPANVGAEPQRIKVLHGYWIDGNMETSDALGKIRLAWLRLTGHGDDSAAVFVYAQEPDAAATLTQYLAEAGAGIRAVVEMPSRQH